MYPLGIQMRIAYCTNVRLPSERAHGHQVARVCDALAGLGHDVTIFAPYRKNPITKDYWEFHNADRKVKVEHLGSFDPIDQWWIPKIFQLPILNLLFQGALSSRLQNFDLFYTRTHALLPVLLNTKKKVILELHTLPNRRRGTFITFCNRCALIVCLTTPMKNELEAWGVTAPIIVEPDAVDLNFFSSFPQKEDARKELKITDLKKFTVGYVGSFVTMGLEKGVKHLVEAVLLLREKGLEIAKIIVGGPASAKTELEHLEKLRSQDKDPGKFLDTSGQAMVKLVYAACDALIYTAPKTNHPYFVRDTSPLKIFEYMAAGKPIVTADLPPIRDILDESRAFFCQPGDSEDLARAIEQVMKDPEEAAKRAVAAHKHVQHYTWDKRMKRILDTISHS